MSGTLSVLFCQIAQQSFVIDISIPILLLRKLRHRRVKEFPILCKTINGMNWNCASR